MAVRVYCENSNGNKTTEDDKEIKQARKTSVESEATRWRLSGLEQ